MPGVGWCPLCPVVYHAHFVHLDRVDEQHVEAPRAAGGGEPPSGSTRYVISAVGLPLAGRTRTR